MTRTLSIDIECVPTTTDVRFRDPTAWDLFAIGVGFRPAPDTPIESEVFVRRGGTQRDERRLLAQLVNWVRRREPHDCLLSFNGTAFDMPILAERAAAVSRGGRCHEATIDFSVYDALDIPHRDLLADIKAHQPNDVKWPSLDEALSSRGLAPPPTVLDGEELAGASMPAFGRRLLAGKLPDRERQALVAYCRSDVEPLFELSDALDAEYVTRAESHARAALAEGDKSESQAEESQ